MDQIKEVLEQDYSLQINQNLENIYAKSGNILAMVVPPHEGNNHKWLVRFSTIAAFDRWANSCAIEETFSTSDDVVNYLKNNKLEIYEQLLDYLSSEYQMVSSLYEDILYQ